MSLAAFDLAIKAFVDQDIPAEVQKLQRVLSIAALNKVVLKTPVDTGRARGAWLVTVDTITLENPAATGALAGSAIAAGVGVIGAAPPFSTIIIQNNVEYIEDLENGTSKQAPSGMLAVTIAELESALQ